VRPPRKEKATRQGGSLKTDDTFKVTNPPAEGKMTGEVQL